MAKKSHKKVKRVGYEHKVQQSKSLSEENKKSQVEKEKKEETVIFMGPPQSLPKKKEIKLLVDSSKESLTQATAKGHTHPHRRRGGMSEMGRLLIGVVVMFMGLVFLIQNTGLYDIVNVTIFDFWPLVLIFLGLFMLSGKRGWRIFSVFILLIIVVVVGGISIGSNVVLGTILSGNIVSEEREITDVTGIVLNGFGVLSIEQGESESLVITADENILSKISTNVTDNNLVIGYTTPFLNLFLFKDVPIIFHVTVIDLESIELNGSGFIESSGITSDILEISIVGSGEVVVHIDVEEFIARISGQGTYTVSGTADRQIIHINGSGSYFGRDLVSDETGVRISGSGDVEVNVQKELNASISGSGKVRYDGSPQISESNVSGSGSIEKFDVAIENDEFDLKTFEKLKKLIL